MELSTRFIHVFHTNCTSPPKSEICLRRAGTKLLQSHWLVQESPKFMIFWRLAHTSAKRFVLKQSPKDSLSTPHNSFKRCYLCGRLGRNLNYLFSAKSSLVFSPPNTPQYNCRPIKKATFVLKNWSKKRRRKIQSVSAMYTNFIIHNLGNWNIPVTQVIALERTRTWIIRTPAEA